MNLSPDPWIWIGALLSLAIFSFLYKENPVYRIAEHVFIGVANGYLVTFYWHNILGPILFRPLFQQGRLILIINCGFSALGNMDTPMNRNRDRLIRKIKRVMMMILGRCRRE